MLRHLGESDRHAYVHHAVLPNEAEVPDRLPQVLGDALSGFESAVLEEHAELVATQAGQRVGGADPGLDDAGELLEKAVAGLVAAGIVDHLELIEVEVQQHVTYAFAAAGGEQRLVEARLELAAIDQAGQRVVARLVDKRPLQPSLLADVVENHHDADQSTAAVTDRGRRVLDRDLDAAAVDQERLLDHLHHAPLAEAAHDRVLDRQARRLTDQVEYVADRTAGRFGRVPAGELLGDRVQVLDAPFGIGGDDRVADRLERDLRLLLFLEKLDLGLLAHRDVGNRTFVADDLAVLVAQQSRVLDHGDGSAVASAELVLRIADHAVAREPCHHSVTIGGVHVQPACRGQAQQLFGTFVAEHSHQRRVDRLEPPVSRRTVDTLDHVLEEFAISRLAAPQCLLGPLALDRDPGQRREARHQFEIALERASRLAEVERDRADHPAIGHADRGRPAGPQARGEGGFPQVLPERIARDLGDHHLSLQEDRRGT